MTASFYYLHYENVIFATMIQKILVANRGEIACRIFRTCKKLGIESVAVFSDADRQALHVQMADEAVYIGESPANLSYLNMQKLIQAAEETHAQAIHPGYGFLAENADFAQLCLEKGLIFIGPNPEAIRAMGSKKEAKQLVSSYGVPVVPGYNGIDQSPETLQKEAHRIGFPLLIKAAAGGGGKGMRIVRNPDHFLQALQSAKNEALAAFADDTILLERYFDTARHLEVQIFGDKHGNVIHLFERECSIQRRYQKIIEEAPSPALHPSLREKITQTAIQVAKILSYDNAGTVEFLLDENDQFYFLEMNTRIQVEHPVTELITGLDLVELQIRVAEGEVLPPQPGSFSGHAIECRLYAEDPYQDFLPRTGKLLTFSVPTLARLDTGVQTGDTIPIFYDPMIAKIITYGNHRQQALQKMLYTLKNTYIQGVTNNQAFLIQVLEHPEFQKGNLSTRFVQQHEKALVPSYDATEYCIAALLYQSLQTPLPLPFLPRGWRNNPYQMPFETFRIRNQELRIEYQWKNHNSLTIYIENQEFLIENVQLDGSKLTFFKQNKKHTWHIQATEKGFEVMRQGLNIEVEYVEKLPKPHSQEEQRGAYLAQMPSEVLKILVQKGQKVSKGTPLMVLASMKIENTLYAHTEGIVEEIYVTERSFVPANTPLLSIQ